ncbi:uncharacterized protein ATNIH1004_009529 [Aspergillus tanneri]|uniref:Uncharacterized protein n=1 Tax=Aspergillus tanneri TaxID=1220188 RepID=A0A5M9MIV8_9EURO|nr:uncharacterized protein ATNIH1004_009529 [Aspergillus tanneri]KAA8642777.1 hypothetical protein ATNIH1004_009529 [Aspergillus tanneri]
MHEVGISQPDVDEAATLGPMCVEEPPISTSRRFKFLQEGGPSLMCQSQLCQGSIKLNPFTGTILRAASTIQRRCDGPKRGNSDETRFRASPDSPRDQPCLAPLAHDAESRPISTFLFSQMEISQNSLYDGISRADPAQLTVR